jgi:NAD(P)-dependent dehydrogenase (short-subunit alcohol dehydrogenase family)
MGKLDGKVAVITGANSGIGLATAERFVDEGAYVFITGRREVELEKACAQIGRNVTAVRGDVAELDDLDRLYATVREEKGALDIVVANAGFVELVRLQDATPEHFDRTFSVNARGSFFTVQKALPLLRDGSSVVLIGSSAQLVGWPEYTTYAATKAAMRSFARTWSADLKDRGIRVNMVSPGPVDTPIIDAQVSTKQEADALRVQFAQLVPMGRIGLPDEVAKAALFLASDDSSFTTGINLLVDGGQTQL